MILHTASTIGKMVGVSRFTIDYVIRRFEIPESGRAGGVRLYDADTARVIVESLGKLPRRTRSAVLASA